MSKFSTRAVRPNVTTPITSTAQPGVTTYEGGQGFVRDAKSELFLLAVTNFVSEQTFYESANDRDDRFESLIHQVTSEDERWMRQFIPWLRSEANMRSASLVAAAEYVKAGGKGGRQLVDAALQRADEPGEMLAYWVQRHGRRIPKPIKRGVADAVRRLFTERAALKYDGQAKAWRLGDVVELVHPEPTGPWQGDLFKYLIDKRHNREGLEVPGSLKTIGKTKQVMAQIAAGQEVSADEIEKAGITWERQSGATKMDAAAWERQIPSMGYMALLRNLRNFDQASITREHVQMVIAKLTNPEEVAKSRQLPMRFLSAYKAVESERWKPALEEALTLSLGNVPVLPGKTLIMVDVSGSMAAPVGGSRSELDRWEAAAVFGSALALRGQHADLVLYNDRFATVEFGRGASIFHIVQDVRRVVGGGTNTWGSTMANYKGHDRVIILTDEQTGGGWYGYGSAMDPGTDVIPLVYTWNLAGYQHGHARSGDTGRYTLGGLSDQSFKAISMLEDFRDGVWPWVSD